MYNDHINNGDADMNTAKIVKNAVNSLVVKSIIAEKGWAKQQAADHVIAFITSGTKKSFYQYMTDAE